MLKKIVLFLILTLVISLNNISFASEDKKAVEAARDDACEVSKTCIDKANFEINVNDISP